MVTTSASTAEASPRVGYPELTDYLTSVAHAYERAQHTPIDPSTIHAYGALKTELWAQFQVLQAFVRVTFTEHDPYGSSQEMFESIAHGSLSVYGNTRGVPIDHPLAGMAPNGQIFNNIFRAVHDGLAHYPERNSFSMKGEFKAYLAHCRLLSHDAQRALFTETVGQNAWYHFGPMSTLGGKVFAEQKATLLPFSLFDNSKGVTP